MRILLPCVLAMLSGFPPLSLASEFARCDGICDASAAVALDRDHFVVADDERNTLLTFRRERSAAVAALQLEAFLGTAPGKESDLEGAAAVGRRVFWISSHGRNKNGKLREERYRFFATDIDSSTVPPSLRPVGAPYLSLLDDLLSAGELSPYKLQEASRRAPESTDGFNIEGLAAKADGGLLIGFRSPVPNGKALLVSLSNPQAVIDGARAKIGAPILIDLGGRGVRSIELVDAAYLIVAGPSADNGSFALYRWSGVADEAPALVTAAGFAGLRPEAIFAVPMSRRLQVLSDDGGVEKRGVACKDQEAARRAFRSILVNLP
jgi:hypothetical protein